jgi:hypothetical protein
VNFLLRSLSTAPKFHELKGDLYRNQPKLPRLPIPSLEETAEKYVWSTSAVLSPEEHKATTAAVSAFVAGEGVSLQKQLKDIDNSNKDTSYISGSEYNFIIPSPSHAYANQ